MQGPLQIITGTTAGLIQPRETIAQESVKTQGITIIREKGKTPADRKIREHRRIQEIVANPETRVREHK